MRAVILEDAEVDLEGAFDYYEEQRKGLGQEFLHEFRRGLDRILESPGSWQQLDESYRRYRLRRFPYGLIYRVDSAMDAVVIVAVSHLSRRPDWWRRRA